MPRVRRTRRPPAAVSGLYASPDSERLLAAVMLTQLGVGMALSRLMAYRRPLCLLQPRPQLAMTQKLRR